MPRTTKVTEPDMILDMLYPEAAKAVREGLAKGLVVEKVESLFSDPGDDYVDFRVAGKTVVHIPGY